MSNLNVIDANQNISVSSDNIKIAATMNYLGDFADALLGDQGIVESVVAGNVDPHFFEPSASDLINLQEADVILAIGHEEIDEWLLDFIKDNSDLGPKVFYVIDLEATLEYDPIIKSDNPHFWLSPINALTMVENIKNHFEELEILEKDILDANYLAYESKLNQLISEIEQQSMIFNGTKVVVDHPAFFYFLNLLGFDRRGAIEEREGVDPSPLHIQELTDLMKNENIKLIIASKTQAGSDVNQLASNTGAKIAFITPLPGISGASNYTEMISYNLNGINNPQEPTSEDGLPIDFSLFIIAVVTPVIIRRKAQKTN
ncbi:MAG: metal ABC transporter substrate-binding protein [Candidatus Kariarchaeaceae archaeon]